MKQTHCTSSVRSVLLWGFIPFPPPLKTFIIIIILFFGIKDLSSPNRDWIGAPCSGRVESATGHHPRACFIASVQFSSVAQSCPTLCDPMNHSTPGLSVHHQIPEFTQTHVHQSVIPSNHLILCHPLLLLPSIFPRIRVFSNELALHISGPKNWSFSFSISTSSEYLGLISFRIDWFNNLVKRINLFFTSLFFIN